MAETHQVTWFANFLNWFRPAPKPPPIGPVARFSADELFAGHNIERASRGIPALTLSLDLCGRADARARNAALAGLTTAHLHDGFTLVKGTNRTGENAAIGAADAPSVMAGWMRSEGHRDNILDPNFTAMGAGRSTSHDGVTYWYVLFTDRVDEDGRDPGGSAPGHRAG